MAERTGKTALITGASAGLGADFAQLFAADGHDVILVARREDKLKTLAARLVEEHGIEAHVIASDLSESSAPQALYDQTKAKALVVSYLVNNAGFGKSGAFSGMNPDGQLQMIAVNVAALTHLTALYLPEMLERDEGRILNIGSTAGFLAGPYMATYYATKAFVNHFSEALWHELSATSVSVTVSCPGPTSTEFAAIAGTDKSQLFKGRGIASSMAVASQAYRAMHQGKRMIVHGLSNKISIFGLRLGPRTTAQRISKRLNQP